MLWILLKFATFAPERRQLKLLRGYLILTRFVAVIVISILASLFWTHCICFVMRRSRSDHVANRVSLSALFYVVESTHLDVTIATVLFLYSSARSRSVRNLLRMRPVASCPRLDSMNTCTSKNWTLPIRDLLDKASVPASLCYCLVYVGYARLFSFNNLPIITLFSV